MARFRSDPDATFRRLRELQAYMGEQVLSPACGVAGELVCTSASECRQSVPDLDLHEGQLSHLGEHFDLYRDDVPLRVMVVGQEFGHGPGGVGLDGRRQMILSGSGRGSAYYASEARPGRNPHMRGTSTVLRLLFGGEAGSDRAGEFLELASGERIHAFDAFSLVNALLCSATVPGTTQGRSTTTMQSNCARHFAATLRILQPTVIVLQGRMVAAATAHHFQELGPVDEVVDRVAYDGGEALRCSFSHPAARDPRLAWGDSMDRPYLDVVTRALRSGFHAHGSSPTV